LEKERVTSQEIESLVKKIPGIFSSKVVMEDKVIKEFHLLTDLSKNPKQISRDIQSTLLAEMNMDIDHRVISIAQIEGDDFLSPQNRVSIEGISKRIDAKKTIYEVTLKLKDTAVTGICEEYNIASRNLAAIIEATIKALEQLYNFEDRIFFEGVEEIHRPNYSVWLVMLSTLFDRERILSGSSVIRDDREYALVRAALSAVNRRLSQL